jgi:hypothetical protein
MRESTGFRGLIRLVALWKDAESLARSNEAAERLSALGADASGSRRRSMREYEVTLFDVP